MILSLGVTGSHGHEPKVACPFHKKTFSLKTGACLSGDDYQIYTFAVRIENGLVYIGLP
ncbi:nitrite reductase (NAD(P)H) small subunit [Fibrella sp. HMF5335]|uniref:Nitrite reductase (NAD(P)H) small subunit n=1 Tax=Fibrella rubiginis TaxID=2817060 RepID=A0A939K7R1_9BACT|nr:nitrite reductase (NAD(P)H) small subunit [Fibrella rubiginis]MBO0938905.1 nitrite reductase (NAD(P)H) small subunit [Fibrella rubiginis]